MAAARDTPTLVGHIMKGMSKRQHSTGGLTWFCRAQRGLGALISEAGMR